ncbi:MAG: hypothetical protein CVU90_13440 [Firmicutes bacterium HGW-Firmicutes-15]|nr:MAG: hypothetical protein CVU90_13440 [Firmicutes bacterium HGW-Firmicutes-15]
MTQQKRALASCHKAPFIQIKQITVHTYQFYHSDGSFIVTATFPEDEWFYGYVLSYGNYAEVLEPRHIRETKIEVE